VYAPSRSSLSRVGSISVGVVLNNAFRRVCSPEEQFDTALYFSFRVHFIAPDSSAALVAPAPFYRPTKSHRVLSFPKPIQSCALHRKSRLVGIEGFDSVRATRNRRKCDYVLCRDRTGDMLSGKTGCAYAWQHNITGRASNAINVHLEPNRAGIYRPLRVERDDLLSASEN